MGGVAGNLPGGTGTAPVMHQAAGGNTEVAAQAVVTAEVQLFVEQGPFQLGIELVIQLTARVEELRASQVTMPAELLLVQ
ncbi:hypothetical protein D3C71_1822160 [compost metagenome]